MIDRLVADFWRRLDLVTACHGNSISQLLSSHMLSPRPQDIADLEVTTFSPEQDAHIVSFINGTPKRARKWQLLHADIPDFSATELRRRYVQLKQEETNAHWAAVRADFILENPDAVEVFANDAEDLPSDVGTSDVDLSDDDPADRGGQLWFGEATGASPIRPLTGYVGFCRANADAVAHLADFGERQQTPAAMWRALPPEDQAAYQASRRPPVPNGKKGRGRPKGKK
jgi:hypothetical protein